tara:strand:+ start:1858 stop:2568 length:711 start_codon:yes stop_codon:yes gene_type:complete
MIQDLKIKIFADGADLHSILKLSSNPLISGFTTNPTLMKKAGVKNYEDFAAELITLVPDKPISFEVFADDLQEMERQARVIATWGRNVNVKIPIMNTSGVFTGPIIQALSNDGIKLNVTAIMTSEQVGRVIQVLAKETPSVISVFAGRVADTGIDPIPTMQKCRDLMSSHVNAELLWASPREVLNLFQAQSAGCHIITMDHGLLEKLRFIGKDLNDFSVETVDMFYRDAKSSGFKI